MYTAFFHLKQAPFSIAPDPQYLFMSERHREALAHLLYGVGSGGGFVLLTGEIGAGKTTVCRCFLEQIPERCKVAYIFNPKMSVPELLHTICDEFGIVPERAASIKDYVDALNVFLLETHARGQNNVLIIDEAQNLAPAVLEQLRLLTNLETNERKLLQIILIGQPELRTMLTRPELEQLAQRVIARYHLGPLSAQETGRYIVHRLRVAGLLEHMPFPARHMPMIQQLTGGVPRRINLLCDRALLGAYAQGKARVDRQTIARAAKEVFDRDPASTSRARWVLGGLLLILLCGIMLVGYFDWQARWGKGKAVTPAVVASASATGSTASAAMRPAANATSNAASNAATNAASNSVTNAASNSVTNAAASPVALPASVPPALIVNNLGVADLAQLWGKSLSGADPCQQAAKKNLRCYSSNGGWDELRELGRPALLSLHDARQGNYLALLLGLSATHARLRLPDQEQVLSLKELEQVFDGEFTTLWTLPRRFRDEVIVGDRGVDVDWIGGQIARIDQLPRPRENAVFDQELSRRVRQFQGAQQLKADGLVGPKTYMRLNRMGGIVEPELARTVDVPAATATTAAATKK